MKKLFTILAATAAMFAGVQNASADPTGVAPETGKTYYIYNVGAKMFLNHGSSWGTHVTVDGAGCEITIGGEEGAYTLHHAGIAAEKYQTEDGWSDNVNAGKFAFEDAGNGAYYMKCSNGKYYQYAGGGAGKYKDEAIVADAKEETEAFQWILVPSAERTAFKAGNDVTYKIVNPDFHGNINGQNGEMNLKGWTTGFGTHETAQLNFSGVFAEKWTQAPGTLADLTHKQTINIPAGKYTLSVAGNSIQQSDGSAGKGTYLFVGDDMKEFDGQNIFSVNFVSTGADIEIGVKTVSTTANWVSFDKFRLVCVEPAVSANAVETASPVTAAAGTWYKVTIPSASAYKVTTTDGATIIYTQDANAFDSEVTTSATSGSDIELAAGALYFKTSAASTVKIAPNVMTYELGTATLSTADGKYTSNATYTVTYPDAGSTDSEAKLTLASGAKATVNGKEVDITAIEKGMSINLGTLAEATDYTISIPANVYGYSGKALNEAINVTVKTPAVIDGTYFLKYGDKKYLSQGGIDHTEAILRPAADAINITTNAEGVSKLKVVATGKYIKTSGSSPATWMDGSDDNVKNAWIIAKNGNGITIKMADANTGNKGTKGYASYVASYTDSDNKTAAEVVNIDADENNAIVWTLETPAKTIEDGIYYVKATDGRYISRGDNYNTCAIADNYGIAVKVETSPDSYVTTFTFVDNNKKLFDANNGTVYTDNTTNPNWAIVAVEGGYNIICKTVPANDNEKNTRTTGNALWIEQNTDANYKFDRLVSKAEGTPAVFTFEATADHPAVMAANKDAQAAAVAAAIGETAITTKAGLDNYVANLQATSIDIEDAVAAGAEVYQNTKDIKQTLTNVANGLYKVCVSGYQRITGHAATWTAHEGGYDSPTTVLYANDQEVQLLGMFDQVVPSAEKRHANDVLYGGNYYPDRMDGAKAAIEAGNYLNEIYVNVTDNTLTFGIFKGNKCGVQDWLYYKDFKVTYYNTATAISTLSTPAQNNGIIYDVYGRKLNGLQKGINIVNGVKVIKK